MPKPRTTPAPPAKKKAPAPPVDWPAVLRSEPDGLARWNKLTKAARTAVDLSGVDLSGCGLPGAVFRGCKASMATFRGCNASRARFALGTFEGADFSAADLTGADFSDANCRRASFAGADLSGVVFKRASLQGADLTGATLAGTSFADATFDKDTKWPSGLDIPTEMTWTGRGNDPRLSGLGKKGIAGFKGLMARLNETIDPNRMKRTLDMLRSGKNQIFSEVEPALVRGIVRSQREPDLVYSCVLTAEGVYSCCTPDLNLCMGLRGEPCKHLLVLLIGLARAGALDAATADRWVAAAAGKNHKWNKTTRNHVSDTLLKYKGVQTGEVDWRPTETIPEDYYAM
jgi:hypothetical protein